MTKRKAFLTALVLAAGVLGATDREIPFTPGDTPPRSISAWDFRGASLARGWRGGKDIVIGSEPEAWHEPGASAATDLVLDFDSPGELPKGGWTMSAGKGLGLGAGRVGPGSARFGVTDSSLELSPGHDSVFSPGRELRDFSIEFWLSPSTTEDGECVFSWTASRWVGKRYQPQEISCTFSGGKLSWTFLNFFQTPGSSDHEIRLVGRNVIVPRTWSHHRLRFDFSSGLLEYLVDGRTMATAYASSTGRDGGTVWFPSVGSKGRLEIGRGYCGLLDRFRIGEDSAEGSDLKRYDSAGGDAFSPVVDTGGPGTRIYSLDAVYRAPGSTGVEFLIRAGEGYADWTDDYPAWSRAIPGKPFGEPLAGRYVQVRARLFTDGAGAESPRVSLMSIRCSENLPPPPPERLLALAGDGTVTLSWAPVTEPDLGGYLIYYGTSPGEYFGSDAAEGRSPLDAGRATSVTLTGLQDGRLYYFAVSAYDMPVAGSPELRREGEFSAETSARPLRAAR